MRPDVPVEGVTTFKQRCRNDPPQLGCWLNLASPLAAELLASCGYDCVLIDREHSPADSMTALSMVHAARAVGSAVLLRVPANDPAEIKRTADLGVDGVMVPQIEGATDARRAVQAAYYPPTGSRGFATGIIRASGFGLNAQYLSAAADHMLLMCQIETARGADAVVEIAEVPGVDLLFVGPYDFSASLGYPGQPDHPVVRRRIEGIEGACRDAGIPIGGIPTPGRSARELIETGYALILSGSDVAFLREGARAQLKDLAEARAAIRGR
ncbi:MAG TPA: aldolase/citrate lyase family protein [Alphaproteobacteria bacterium]|nr:aldolase/citrate lyase family protein [Alphaproteobacteria bacterium]